MLVDRSGYVMTELRNKNCAQYTKFYSFNFIRIQLKYLAVGIPFDAAFFLSLACLQFWHLN